MSYACNSEARHSLNKGDRGSDQNMRQAGMTDVDLDIDSATEIDGQSDEYLVGATPVLLPSHVQKWQLKSQCKFNLLAGCEVAIPASMSDAFDSPVPVSLDSWLNEPVAQQCTLLCLMGCRPEQVLAAMRHARRVLCVQDSSVCFVMSAVQRWRLRSLSLDAGLQTFMRFPRGACMFQAANAKHKIATCAVHVLQLAQRASAQAAGKKLSSLFQGSAGGRPAGILLDTGASDCFVSADMADGMAPCSKLPSIQVGLANGQVV